MSGIVVIDVDLPAAFASLARLIEAELPTTLTGFTGGGGVHLIYSSSDEVLGNSAGRLSVSTMSSPGSICPATAATLSPRRASIAAGVATSGWSANHSVASAPSWLKQPERVHVALNDVAGTAFDGDGTPYGLAVLRDELDRVKATQVGTRNHELNRSAFTLAGLVAGGELLEAAARSSLLGVALAIGLDEPESRQTIDSAFDAGLRSPRVAPHRMR